MYSTVLADWAKYYKDRLHYWQLTYQIETVCLGNICASEENEMEIKTASSYEISIICKLCNTRISVILDSQLISSSFAIRQIDLHLSVIDTFLTSTPSQ